jgi:predicted dehydrogenase
MARLRWGVLSTAGIGRLVIEATRAADHAEFVAVASRDADRARAFAGELGLEASFGSYEELLASSQVDAVYVPLPVAMHTEWTVKALEAGKHVLCEKPFATSAADAARCFDAAEAAGRYCVEGLMYRHHPQTTLARQLVAGGAIGRLAATLRLPADVLAQFDVALDLTRRDELELVGTAGRLTVPDPWLCRATHLELSRDGQVEHVPVDPEGAFALTDPDHDVYRIELDTVSAALAGGGQPSFGRSDALAQATVLEALDRSANHGGPVDVSSGG